MTCPMQIVSIEDYKHEKSKMLFGEKISKCHLLKFLGFLPSAMGYHLSFFLRLHLNLCRGRQTGFGKRVQRGLAEIKEVHS